MTSKLTKKGKNRWSIALLIFSISGCFCTSLAAEDQGIKVYGWSGAKGAVDELIEHYEVSTGQSIEFSLIDTKHYMSDVEESQIYGGDIDIYSFPPSEAIRFLNAGWMGYLPSDTVYEQLNADLYENVREGMLHEDRILGLNQFASAMVLPLVDDQRYQEIGLDSNALPADWGSLYEQVNERARAGHTNIYLPHWFDGVFGLTWGFIAEVLNRGGHIIDPELHSVVMAEREGPAFDTLSDWRQAIETGAADLSALDMSYPEYVSAFRSGKYAISPQAMGQLFSSSVFEIAATPRRKLHILPRVQQNWGILGLSLVVSTNRNDSAERRTKVRDFLYTYAYGEDEYRHRMPKEWLELGLFSGYKTFMESAQAQEILARNALDPAAIPDIMETFKNTPYPTGAWKVIWYFRFEEFLKETLKAFLTDSTIRPEDVISQLNNKILSLRMEYGG